MFLLIFLIGTFTQTVSAQIYAKPEVIEEMKKDIDFWLGQQQVDSYLLWQYSGPSDKYFGNDKYSFFQGSPVCAALREKSTQYPGKIGVNIPNLKNEEAVVIQESLSYLKNDCGISIVRMLGAWEERNGTNKVKSILDVAEGLDIKIIIAITNYAGGSLDIMPSEILSNPTSWYASGYLEKYLPHAKVVAKGIGGHPALYTLELANEPHCSGKLECVDKYVQWVNNTAREMKSANSTTPISIGQAASETTTRGDSPPSDYKQSNSSSFLSHSTAHHYGNQQNQHNLVAKSQTSKTFYIGEAGFEFGEKPSGDGSDDLSVKRPLDEGFTPGKYACVTGVKVDEFHPLRPYPANSCDPLIPQAIPSANSQNSPEYKKYITYACAPEITPIIEEVFDPYGNSPGCYKDPTTNKVTCYREETVDVTVNLKDSNLGILGNTQDPTLTDSQKVNNYLSYYLTGVPQVSDQKQITSEEDIDRLVNFSGPIRKLLPWDLQNSQARKTVANAIDTQDVHDYQIGSKGPFGAFDQKLSNTNTNIPDMNDAKYRNNEEQYYKDLNSWRYGNDSFLSPNIYGFDLVQTLRSIFDIETASAKFFQNTPLSSLEDIAGEFVFTIFGPGVKQDVNVVTKNDNTNSPFPNPKIVIRSSNSASGNSGSNNPPQAPSPGEPVSCDKDLRIMPFGDSITVGVPSQSQANAADGGYRGELKRLLTSNGFKVDYVGSSTQLLPLEVQGDPQHEGWGGQNTDWLSQRLPIALETQKSNGTLPDMVLIHAGTNNLSNLAALDDNGSPIYGVEGNIYKLKKIINTIRSYNSETVIFVAKIIAIPKYEHTNTVDRKAYNDRIASEIDSLPNVVVVDMSSIQPGDDQVHPDGNGYRDMAQAWATEIRANCK